MSCSTSALLGHINVYRNPPADAKCYNIGKVALAELAYIVLIPYTIVEAAISQVVKAIAKCMKLDAAKYQKIEAWAASSGHCALWVIHSVFVNLCVKQICATEKEFVTDILRKNTNPLPPPTEPELGESGEPEEPVLDVVQPEPEPAPVEPIPEVIQPEPAPVNPLPKIQVQEPAVVIVSPKNDLSPTDETTPTSKDPAVSNQLRNYVLGENAKKYSTLMAKIYSEIPEPDVFDLFSISDKIGQVLTNHCPNHTRNAIVNYFEGLVDKSNRQTWEDRFLKMVIAIYNVIIKSKDDSQKAILAMGLLDAYQNCSNRKSTEIERLYFTYVSPNLMDAIQESITPQETLIYEMMQHRMKIRDKIINALCDEAHNAASHRYFRAKLNKDVFFLPPPILCEEDQHYEGYALKGNEDIIIWQFQGEYTQSPHAIYDIFNGLLYPKQGEAFKFKTDMFSEWLKENELMNADAFADDALSVYKPELIIAYLQHMGFLKHK